MPGGKLPSASQSLPPVKDGRRCSGTVSICQGCGTWYYSYFYINSQTSLPLIKTYSNEVAIHYPICYDRGIISRWRRRSTIIIVGRILFVEAIVAKQ